MRSIAPCLLLLLAACGQPVRPTAEVPTVVAPVVSAIPALPAPVADPRLVAIAAEVGLRKQEERELSRFYLRSGKRLSDDLRYKDALADLDRAVRLDPENGEARALHERLLLITGEGRGHKAVIEALAHERQALIEQERIELSRLYTEGVDLFRAQRYAAAIDRFERVLEKVRWFPYALGPDDTGARAEAGLKDARALARVEGDRARERRQQAALEQARALGAR